VIVGAGQMVKPIVDYFISHGYHVVVMDMFVEKAIEIKDGRPECTALEWKDNDPVTLDGAVKDAEVVISMVPKPVHIHVLKSCLRFRKSMITASYEVPELFELKDEVEAAGILVLNELGEVPGMDHFGTQLILDGVRRDGGRVLSLKSYGSGIPSFESNNNPFGYKFCWDPYTVFVAAQTSGAYITNGERIFIPGEELFGNFWFEEIEGLGTFETYANKDVEKYVQPFGLDDDVTFYRGLLRYSGYCNNMKYMRALGLFEHGSREDLTNKSYREFTAELIGEDPADIEKKVPAYLKVEENADIIHRLKWLGLFSDIQIPLNEGTHLDVLLSRMLERMVYAPGEKDMIILYIDVIAEFDDGRKERRTALMVVKGDPDGDTAMSKAVALPTAIAARLVAEKKVVATGFRMPPTLPEIYKPALEELATYGFEFTTKTIPLD